MIPVCWACMRPTPQTMGNEHHVRPRAAGGDDGEANKKWLCAGCHQSLHRMSEMILRGAPGLAQDAASVMYTDPAARQRVLFLAKEAAVWVRKFEESVPEVALASVAKQVTISFSGVEYGQLVTLAGEALGGRRKKPSVPNFIRKLIKTELAKKFRSQAGDWESLVTPE